MSTFSDTNETAAKERQELRDAGPMMIHQHGKGKQECLMIEGNTNPRVTLTALRVLRKALGEPA